MRPIEAADKTDEPANRPDFVVITVHGTFAGVPDEQRPFWWQAKSQLHDDICQCKSGAAFRSEPFVWRDAHGQKYGPNRESERRRAGLRLLQCLRKLEADKTPYHLIGHSHGGSVIWHALRSSAVRGSRLEHLQGWCTVGTPFLDFGSDRSAWWRIAAAATVVGALVWWGLLGGLWSFVNTAYAKGLEAAVDAVPLLNEFGEVQAALGDTTFHAVLTLIALICVVYGTILLLPARDVFRMLAGYFRRNHDRLAAEWYDKSWLGIVHRQDEALTGLRATLIRPPHLVLRRRQGLLGYMLRIFDPLAAIVDQFAWGILMKNAQGADLPASALRSVGTAPPGFKRGPISLPTAVSDEIVARADKAAAGVLARVRLRLENAGDKEDLEALTGVLNGTYDRDSLIHTTMFESAWIRSTIVSRMFAPADIPAQEPATRSGKPWFALPLAKVAVAVGLVLTLGTLMLFTYRAVIHPQTNVAQADRVLKRFEDPSFQIIANSAVPAKALARAYRLGAPLEKVFAAAEKLSDDQTEAAAYQAIVREMALNGRLDEVAGWLDRSSSASPPVANQRYRRPDYLTPALIVALEAVAQSGEGTSPAMARLFSYASAPSSRATTPEQQIRLLRRLIPIAISLHAGNPLPEWLKQIGGTDRTCDGWSELVISAAALVRNFQQVQLLETVIQGCNAASAAATEDKRRMLRRLAVGALSNCRISMQMLAQSSFNRAGADAPIPPRFIECLVAANRRDDAAKLVAAGRGVRSEGIQGIRHRLDIAVTLERLQLRDESRKWAELALNEVTQVSMVTRDPDLDALRFSILKFLDHATLQDFVSDGQHENLNRFSPLIKIQDKLRSMHVQQLDRADSKSCDGVPYDSRDAGVALELLRSYPDELPLAMWLVRIAAVCKSNLSPSILRDMLVLATANNDSSKRGVAISELAPYAASLRAGLDIADTAAVPVAVLESYVRVVDRLRPALKPKFDKDFEPIQYVAPSRSFAAPSPAPPAPRR